MKKIRTLGMLQDFLDGEFSWRLKEVADLKIAVRKEIGETQKTFIRASVPMIYAHWEGFVKNSTIGYLNFVNCQRLRYDQLTSCFIVFGIKRRLNELTQSHKARLNIEAVDFFFDELGNRAKIKPIKAIETKSNLNSNIFENISLSIGIDPSPYKTRYNFIDISLLKRRNEIAHGKYIDLEVEDCRTLADEVLFLMRKYKDDIEYAADQKLYMRSENRIIQQST